MPVPPRQREIYLQGAAGRTPSLPLDYSALEEAARRRLRPSAYAYLAGGAGREDTMAANRSAFGRWSIVPRMLTDVSGRAPGLELFGRRLSAPLLLCPIGVLELAHPQGDLAVARAARGTGSRAL